MTPEQTATVAFADAILNAPEAHLALEPPDCLWELADTASEHLSAFMAVGNGWRVIELALLKAKTESRLALSQQEFGL